MERSYLIQRLGSPKESCCNYFSFGGGQKNGGLTDEAVELLDPIFSFDYMGSSEFEWGAVPKALDTISKYSIAGNGTTGQIELLNPVYYICATNQKDHLTDLVTTLALEGDFNNNLKLREVTLFQEALNNPNESRAKGWLELDNGFMFFVNQEMYEKTADLFGLK
jgi:hypothetical protein